MNNEIKEILDFKENADYKRLSCDEIAILRDYITNLQQLHQASLDIQELTERDIECPSWCDKLTNLQQENVKLSKQHLETINKLIETQERIEKAVEYIRTNEGYSQLSGMWDFYGDTDEIVKILRGEDNDN